MIYKVKNLTVAYEIPGLDKKDLHSLSNGISSNWSNINRFQKATNEIILITKWLTKHNIDDFVILTGALLNTIIEKSYIEIVFNSKDDMVYFITGY